MISMKREPYYDNYGLAYLVFLFLLDSRNGSPSGPAGTNRVLVGHTEKVSLLIREFLTALNFH
jgi:hypothetical protein